MKAVFVRGGFHYSYFFQVDHFTAESLCLHHVILWGMGGGWSAGRGVVRVLQEQLSVLVVVVCACGVGGGGGGGQGLTRAAFVLFCSGEGRGSSPNPICFVVK